MHMTDGMRNYCESKHHNGLASFEYVKRNARMSCLCAWSLLRFRECSERLEDE